MNDEMNGGEAEIKSSVAKLTSFIPRLEKGNGALEDPEQQQPANKKSHPFQGALFEGSEIM